VVLAGTRALDGIFGRNDEGSYNQSTLFETDTMKLARVQLGPGGLLPEHRHDRCHVLISLAQASLLDSASALNARELRLSSGDAQWYPGPVTHTLKNLGKQDVQLITLELS